MLHLLTETSLSQAVTERIAAADSLVLLGGALWAAQIGHSCNRQLQMLLERDCRIYVMDDFVAASGINLQQLLSGVNVIDYAELVELTVQHPLIHTWC